MDDLIRRSDAIRLIKRWMVRLDDVDASEKTEISGYNLGLLTAEREVSTLPAVEPTTKVVAQVNVDTEDVVRRIKEEYDIIDGWIPCEERLPEDIRPVLVTWKNNDPKSYYQYIVGKHFIGTAHYHRGKWYWYSSVTEDVLAEYGEFDTEEFDEAIEPIAWMPLPEPYMKGADDD